MCLLKQLEEVEVTRMLRFDGDTESLKFLDDNGSPNIAEPRF